MVTSSCCVGCTPLTYRAPTPVAEQEEVYNRLIEHHPTSVGKALSSQERCDAWCHVYAPCLVLVTDIVQR